MHGHTPTAGTVVWIRRQRWRLLHAQRQRNVVRFDVTDGERHRTFLTPFDRLERVESRTRPRRAGPGHAMARFAGLIARTGSLLLPLSLVDADIDILPHQIEPVLAVLQGVRRVLVADEVGLGKTVQAGIVIAELQRRRRSTRVLVIAPAALAEQWRHELGCRFGIASYVANRRLLEGIVRTEPRGLNPWTRSGVWLVSADYLKQPHVLGSMPRAPWDLVVIDEAHDTCGDSDRHKACTEAARRARHVMLLTATPHSGDAERFRRLEHMGRLAGLNDGLTMFRRTRTELSLALKRAVRWHRITLTAAERAVLDALMAFEMKSLSAAARLRKEDGAVLLLSVFRKRVLSTMAALEISIANRLRVLGDAGGAGPPVWLQPSLDFAADDELSDEDQLGLTAASGLGESEERLWLNRLRGLVHTAAERESKLARLTRLVSRTDETVVVFTEFRHSLTSIERHLSTLRSVVVLHGGQTAAERRGALERFLRGHASALVATDVAGQGLNLQGRARWVVSFELPWNPVRLEQRIGRVDRIGQTRSVHATLLIARHIAETGILSRLAERAVQARRTLGTGAFGDIVPPTAVSLGQALIAGSALETPATRDTVAMSCATWRRTARAVTRQLIARRSLARRWRSPLAPAGRPVWTPSRRSSRDGLSLAILSVPLIDRRGVVVESVVYGIRLAGMSRPALKAQSNAIAGLAARAIRSRSRRVARLIARRSEADRRTETAIAAELSAGALSAELQPGLFDRRAVRAFDAARMEATDLVRRANETAGDLQGTELEVGPARIELVVLGRR